MAPMTLTPQSKRIHAYGYHAASQTLSVQFKRFKGDARPVRYDYQHVPPDVFAGLEAAESKGSYITRNVVTGNPFEFQKVDLSAAEEAAPAI